MTPDEEEGQRAAEQRERDHATLEAVKEVGLYIHITDPALIDWRAELLRIINAAVGNRVQPRTPTRLNTHP